MLRKVFKAGYPLSLIIPKKTETYSLKTKMKYLYFLGMLFGVLGLTATASSLGSKCCSTVNGKCKGTEWRKYLFLM
jgi:hypothetical protein